MGRAGGFPLVLHLRPSRQTRLVMAVPHVLAATAFLLAGLPLPVLILAGGCLAGVWFWTGRGARRARRLILRENGTARLEGEGAAIELQAGAACVAWRWALWLHLEGALPRECRRLMVLRDQLSPDAWRLLNQWVRLVAPAAVARRLHRENAVSGDVPPGGG